MELTNAKAFGWRLVRLLTTSRGAFVSWSESLRARRKRYPNRIMRRSCNCVNRHLYEGHKGRRLDEHAFRPPVEGQHSHFSVFQTPLFSPWTGTGKGGIHE